MQPMGEESLRPRASGWPLIGPLESRQSLPGGKEQRGVHGAKIENICSISASFHLYLSYMHTGKFLTFLENEKFAEFCHLHKNPELVSVTDSDLLSVMKSESVTDGYFWRKHNSANFAIFQKFPEFPGV